MPNHLQCQTNLTTEFHLRLISQAIQIFYITFIGMHSIVSNTDQCAHSWRRLVSSYHVQNLAPMLHAPADTHISSKCLIISWHQIKHKRQLIINQTIVLSIVATWYNGEQEAREARKCVYACKYIALWDILFRGMRCKFDVRLRTACIEVFNKRMTM